MGRREKRNTYSARGRTNHQIVVDLVTEWHPMWLTPVEIVMLAPRHIPKPELDAIINDAATAGVIRVDDTHRIPRIYHQP